MEAETERTKKKIRQKVSWDHEQQEKSKDCDLRGMTRRRHAETAEHPKFTSLDITEEYTWNVLCFFPFLLREIH